MCGIYAPRHWINGLSNHNICLEAVRVTVRMLLVTLKLVIPELGVRNEQIPGGENLCVAHISFHDFGRFADCGRWEFEKGFMQGE